MEKTYKMFAVSIWDVFFKSVDRIEVYFRSKK